MSVKYCSSLNTVSFGVAIKICELVGRTEDESGKLSLGGDGMKCNHEEIMKGYSSIPLGGGKEETSDIWSVHFTFVKYGGLRVISQLIDKIT